jgi:hypothetical protein
MVFTAGGWKSHISMTKYLANQLGASSLIMRFDNDKVDKVKGELERIIGYPIIGRGIDRFLRVSNMGKSEELLAEVEAIRKMKANELLDIRSAIIKQINEIKPLTGAQIKSLYEKMVKNGQITRTTYQTFEKNYRTLLAFREDSPYVNAYLSARSNEEKAHIVEKALADQRLK